MGVKAEANYKLEPNSPHNEQLREVATTQTTERMACSQLQRYPKASVKRIGSTPRTSGRASYVQVRGRGRRRSGLSLLGKIIQCGWVGVCAGRSLSFNDRQQHLSDTHVSPSHATTVLAAPSGPALLEVHGTVRYAGATCRSGPKHVEEEGRPRAWLARHCAEMESPSSGVNSVHRAIADVV
ncbi:hypothetical protein B0H14DRAFT_3144046 [Mycena olivaceomarginata]|nr:hypothetical protein B0H14DRAFT_3144046 [Mycena olivaceomarginata]